VRETLTQVELLAARIGTPRTLLWFLLLAVSWALVNQVLLTDLGVSALDPYPFRWLQRISIVGNCGLVYICLRARSERQRRAKLARELFERLASLQAAAEAHLHTRH
jgi:uncharacterized membrane protein